MRLSTITSIQARERENSTFQASKRGEEEALT